MKRCQNEPMANLIWGIGKEVDCDESEEEKRIAGDQHPDHCLAHHTDSIHGGVYGVATEALSFAFGRDR